MVSGVARVLLGLTLLVVAGVLMVVHLWIRLKNQQAEKRSKEHAGTAATLPRRSVAGMPHAAGPASLFVGDDKGGMEEAELAPVLVVWTDSMQQEGWGRYMEGVSLECVSIGHLFRQNDEVVVVALSRTAALFGSYMTIPRLAVKSITPLVPAVETCVRKRRPTRR